MMRIKKAIFTVAALTALSCAAAFTAGCQHTRDHQGSGTGGDTGTGSGGTIDTGGSRMDQGRGTYGTETGTGSGNGSGSDY